MRCGRPRNRRGRSGRGMIEGGCTLFLGCWRRTLDTKHEYKTKGRDDG